MMPGTTARSPPVDVNSQPPPCDDPVNLHNQTPQTAIAPTTATSADGSHSGIPGLAAISPAYPTHQPRRHLDLLQGIDSEEIIATFTPGAHR
jgi:hypothetical protein